MCQFNYNIFHFQIFHKIWNVTPVFRSLLDLVSAVLVFAVFSWNVTPANNEGRLYCNFFLEARKSIFPQKNLLNNLNVKDISYEFIFIYKKTFEHID
jgi:hypothetical protein